MRFDEWEKATPEQRDWASVHLENCNLFWVHLNQAKLRNAHLERTNLSCSHLEEADLSEAHLEEANLLRAHLEKTHLIGAHLERVNLSEVHLEKARLENIILSDKKHTGPYMVHAQLGDTNLAVVKWSQIEMLADEYEARERRCQGEVKSKVTLIAEYERAVRTNLQLAVALQNQGLNEDATRFTYRARILQRTLLWKQRNFWSWSGSMMLALLTGYGYRMGRILVAYLFIVLLCSVAYFVLGRYYEPHLSFLESVLTSITAFHGRVFSEPFPRPGEPQIWVTAFEAIAGLIIEGVFIAMLTQKFFSK